MNDSADDMSLLPSELDQQRLESVEVDGRVEAENGSWVVLRYPTPAHRKDDWKWCEWSLLVNHPEIPARGAPYEFKNLKALRVFLAQLNKERRRTQ